MQGAEYRSRNVGCWVGIMVWVLGAEYRSRNVGCRVGIRVWVLSKGAVMLGARSLSGCG